MTLPRTTRILGDVDGERRRNDVAAAVNALPFPPTARTLAGLTFTAGQVRTLSHGLGRAAVGYLAVNARTSAPLLYRTDLGAVLEKISLKLTHSGASSTTFDLVVW